MAHILKINSLIDELITLLTSCSAKNKPTKFNAYHEAALRTLRLNNYARINQFDVQHQLEGLEEKFRVYNEDDLADALRQRLDELAKRSQKWAPEVLHLLLELSDKPVLNSSLDGLDFLKPRVEKEEPRYKWEDFAAEDPLLRDANVWLNIDYGAESSDDESISLDSDLEVSSRTENTAISRIEDESLSKLPDSLKISADLANLSLLEASQFWRGKSETDMAKDGQGENETRATFITELQAIREVLFMLSGLPSSLFITHRQDGGTDSATNASDWLRTPKILSGSCCRDGIKDVIMLAPTYALRHTSSSVFHGLLAQFAEFGNSISVLRVWTRSEQSIPLLQSLRAEVVTRLRLFDDMMSNMQSRYVEPRHDLIISLVEVHANVAASVRLLLKVSHIIKLLNSEPYAHTFRFLELLHAETCASQMAGDENLYEYLATFFFDCFRVYLRQIRKWMEDGELWKDDHVFFILKSVEEFELASLWSSQYKLRKTSNGTLHAPKFLHPATSGIFNTGKSVVVLKALRKYDRAKRSHFEEEPKLDFKTVCGSASLFLAPFSDLFDVAFDQWVKSKRHVTLSTLRRCLLDDCGLRDSLSAMENIYFMVDGNITSQFANALFEKLDSGESTWNDRYTLTELARGTIGSLSSVIVERLKATALAMRHADVQKSRKSVKVLSTFTLTYSLQWPVQIIVARDSIPLYQKIFSFLLQIRRSAYVLQGFRLVKLNKSNDGNMLYYGVRSRLLWFSSALYSYLTDLVIGPNTKQMLVALGEAEDVDGMIDTHQCYIKKLTDQALLGPKLEPIHNTIITILDLSVQLSDARTIQTTAQTANSGSVGPTHDILLHQSLTQNLRVRERALGRKTYPDSSEEDINESDPNPSAIWATQMELSYTDQLRMIRSEFDSLCNFVITGLRGVVRAGGEPNWDMLADKLESGIGV